MRHLSLLESNYRRKHLACVRHITLDPTGPGVVRIHMIPPHSQPPDDPFLLLLNGAQLVPLNFSWATAPKAPSPAASRLCGAIWWSWWTPPSGSSRG